MVNRQNNKPDIFGNNDAAAGLNNQPGDARASRIWRKKNVRGMRQWLVLARHSEYNARALADLCGVTMRQLERYFDGDLGRSPQDWLNEQRLVAARYLLLETPMIKTVCSDLGYKRLSHFSRDFKRCYGLTPSQFRQGTGDFSTERPE